MEESFLEAKGVSCLIEKRGGSTGLNRVFRHTRHNGGGGNVE